MISMFFVGVTVGASLLLIILGLVYGVDDRKINKLIEQDEIDYQKFKGAKGI
jgi:hypothetical protein